MGILWRITNLLQHLQRNQELFDSYDHPIQKQIAKGVVEQVSEKVIVASKNSIYHAGHLFIKMMKVQSCELFIKHSQRKTEAIYH